jgi:hypothetical protein
MLVVSYSSREWADRCTKLEVAQEWIGPTEAQALIQMIAELEACQNAAEMIEFSGATTDDVGCVMVDFSRKHRAIFEVTVVQPNRANVVPDWSQVRRLTLTNIVEL